MSRHLPLFFIIATVLIDAIGIGLIFPVLPSLIREVTGKGIADAAIWGGVLATGFAAMQFLFGPIVGNMSDRYGRKPILLSALFLMMIDYMFMAVAHTIWLLLAGRLIAGLTAATPSTAAAYIADISDLEDRERNFGYLHAAFGVGFAMGPVIGGLLATFDTRAPFYAAAAFAGLNMVFGLIVMPESLRVEKRRPFSLRRANPFSSFKAIGSLKGLAGLLAVFGLYQLAYFVYPAVWAFYAEARFGFDTATIGLTLFIFGATMALTQALLVGPVVKRFGPYLVAMGGIALDIIVFLGLGLTKSVAMIWILSVLSGLSAISTPALQGMMSRATPDNQQGELHGITSSIAALATIMSPLLMTKTFAYFSAPDAPIFLPGAPFLLSTGFVLIGGVVLWQWHRNHGTQGP
ncbi:TCR/Tet family MFS transporter [Celeribacter litoreus]|uniref:TCR/Tet family MFS transporter n=1 Tax=Celeribacter litoreus TaxID=2876714 RepID=UPI001CCCB0E3|nr:TCR/Tet family MFS transporter [Celeribacter litoreus]MCA0044159.1 TCR/Tet family MFS transporter [Celeribacter litoreus]